MAAKNVSISLSANTNYEIVESVLKITGKTVYGKTVTATTAINQAAVAGSVAVSIMSMSVDNDGHVDGASGEVQYSVGWTGLKTGTTINLAGTTGMSNITPSSITVNRVSSTFPQTVTVNRSALSSGSRNLTLTATGIDNNGDSTSDSASYTQHAASGTGGSSLSVSAVTSSPVAASTTSVTFNVTYSNIWGTINLSPSIGTASHTTIDANGSGTTQVTVTVPANTGHTSKNITLTATTDFNDKTANATIVQNGLGYNPKIWWTKTSGGASSTSATSINDVPAYVSGTYDGQDVIYTIYINYNSDVSANTITLNTSSLTGATATRSGKTITITVPVNEATTAKSLGSITVNAKAPDGTNTSATLSVTQVAGVSPSFTISPATQDKPAAAGTAYATLTYNYVDASAIASGSTSGNVTSVTIS